MTARMILQMSLLSMVWLALLSFAVLSDLSGPNNGTAGTRALQWFPSEEELDLPGCEGHLGGN